MDASIEKTPPLFFCKIYRVNLSFTLKISLDPCDASPKPTILAFEKNLLKTKESFLKPTFGS